MLNLFIIYCFNLLYSAFIYCILHLFIAYRIYLLHAAFIYCMPYLFIAYCIYFCILQMKKCKCKKSFKIPKGKSKPVNRRRTDNTIAKIKKKNIRINNDLHNITHKIRDRETRTALISWSELRCSRRVSSLCSTDGTRSVTLITNPVVSHEWRKDSNVIKTSDQW